MCTRPVDRPFWLFHVICSRGAWAGARILSEFGPDIASAVFPHPSIEREETAHGGDTVQLVSTITKPVLLLPAGEPVKQFWHADCNDHGNLDTYYPQNTVSHQPCCPVYFGYKRQRLRPLSPWRRHLGNAKGCQPRVRDGAHRVRRNEARLDYSRLSFCSPTCLPACVLSTIFLDTATFFSNWLRVCYSRHSKDVQLRKVHAGFCTTFSPTIHPFLASQEAWKIQLCSEMLI